MTTEQTHMSSVSSPPLLTTPTEQLAIPTIPEPALKRPLDVVLATIMIIASIPVTLIIVLAIKLEDGGPIFFFQERWGRKGKRFWAYKFRTMIPDADKHSGVRQATHNDRRITRTGKVLRAMGLDELPQVINIWKGEMSFVGPRALAVGETISDGNGGYTTYDHIPGYYERLAVRPGLTSIATIYIPKDSPPRRKFRYDRLYIQKLSFWLDVRLILLSFWISFSGKWESRSKKL